MAKAENLPPASIPMSLVGPILLSGAECQGEISVPLATFETPLWPSVGRGAGVTRLIGGLRTVVVSECMTRSVVVQAPSAERALAVTRALALRHDEIASVVASTSRFARFLALEPQLLGDLLYLRLAISTGDASGHNMVTLAADRLLTWLLAEYPDLQYGSISANYCTDKKVSAVNGILGRGRQVIAEAVIPAAICQRLLKTTPARLVTLHTRKNLLGGILAGSLRTANAHFANMLLALYLATGQDAANLVEGSQGMVHAEQRGEDLYFSVTLPHLIVGTVGNGKALPFVRDNLARLGCLEPRPPGANARRLAVIAAATVWCGELSLLAAQTNPGELMAAHTRLERQPGHG